MVIFLSICIFVAAAGGFYFGRNYSADTQEKTRLEADLKQKTEELEAFQSKVTGHFEKTANLFNQVSDSYQSLYDHMAHSSSQLCSSQSFRALPKSARKNVDSIERNSQSEKDAQKMFNADALYNAYDYRNQQEIEDDSTESVIVDHPVKKDNKVVDIETAKEDKNSPALDYAIKEKGVINHNSLNIDDVKTS